MATLWFPSAELARLVGPEPRPRADLLAAFTAYAQSAGLTLTDAERSMFVSTRCRAAPEVATPETARANTLRDEGRTFETALHARPADLELRQRFGAWLAQQGDAWGPLITAKPTQPSRGRDVLRRHLRAIVGDLADFPLHHQLADGSGADQGVTLWWDEGFITRAALTYATGVMADGDHDAARQFDVGEAVEALLANRPAMLLRELTIDAQAHDTGAPLDFTEVARLLATRAPRHLERLALTGVWSEPNGPARGASLGDLTALLAALPALTHLELHVGTLEASAPLAHERLERLAVFAGPLEDGPARGLLQARLPRCRELSLSLGERLESKGELSLLVETAALPSLKSLVLWGPRHSAEDLTRLAESKLLTSLQQLLLRPLEPAARLVAQHEAARFAHLSVCRLD